MTHSLPYDSLCFLVTHSASDDSFTSFITHPLTDGLLITYSLLTDPLLYAYSFTYIAQLAHIFKEDTSDSSNLRSV